MIRALLDLTILALLCCLVIFVPRHAFSFLTVKLSPSLGCYFGLFLPLGQAYQTDPEVLTPKSQSGFYALLSRWLHVHTHTHTHRFQS